MAEDTTTGGGDCGLSSTKAAGVGMILWVMVGVTMAGVLGLLTMAEGCRVVVPKSWPLV